MGWMNRTVLIALGVIATIISSFVGLVALPEHQLDSLEPVTLENGDQLPAELGGLAATGREVYIDLGCIYCHSQQVRPPDYGADIERGWGTRQTRPIDHIYDDPPLLGTMRTGPDLANIAARQPSADWHYLHLYDPELTSPGSIMPEFPFLFEEVAKEDVRGRPDDALELPKDRQPEDAWVVPDRRGRALVAYLLSLDHTWEVPDGARDGQ